VFTKPPEAQRDQLLELFELTRRFEFRKAVVARLRAEAKVTTMPDELKKLTGPQRRWRWFPRRCG